MTTQGERRLDVPEGLDGERLDAALARMFGLSRSKAAELIGDGMVLLDGRPAAKSDRVLAGEPLQVTLPSPPPAEPPRRVEGLIVLYEDEDIIVAVDGIRTDTYDQFLLVWRMNVEPEMSFRVWRGDHYVDVHGLLRRSWLTGSFSGYDYRWPIVR